MKNLTAYLANIIMLGKSSPSQKELAKVTVEAARKRNPKAYFQAVKRLTKWSKQSLIAVSFATSETSPNSTSFKTYIEGLYGTDPSPLPYKPTTSYLAVSEYDLDMACYKLSHNKATGLDGLKDNMIKVMVKH